MSLTVTITKCNEFYNFVEVTITVGFRREEAYFISFGG